MDLLIIDHYIIQFMNASLEVLQKIMIHTI